MNSNRKHDLAIKAAFKEAEEFFLSHPTRRFHVQKSRPFQGDGWGRHDHRKWSHTMFFWDSSTGKSRLRSFPLASEGRIPDTDEFLFEIWSRYVFSEQKVVDIGPLEHGGYLLLKDTIHV